MCLLTCQPANKENTIAELVGLIACLAGPKHDTCKLICLMFLDLVTVSVTKGHHSLLREGTEKHAAGFDHASDHRSTGHLCQRLKQATFRQSSQSLPRRLWLGKPCAGPWATQTARPNQPAGLDPGPKWCRRQRWVRPVAPWAFGCKGLESSGVIGTCWGRTTATQHTN